MFYRILRDFKSKKNENNTTTTTHQQYVIQRHHYCVMYHQSYNLMISKCTAWVCSIPLCLSWYDIHYTLFQIWNENSTCESNSCGSIDCCVLYLYENIQMVIIKCTTTSILLRQHWSWSWCLQHAPNSCKNTLWTWFNCWPCYLMESKEYSEYNEQDEYYNEDNEY